MRHKLSLDVNYVSDWTEQDAFRELFQNAIDWGNWSSSIEDGKLCIISHNAVLETKTILLGSTTKKNQNKLGQYGEGFKLAMLVLTRLGYKCKIGTGNEVWFPKLINSRTYKTQQLVFDTEKNQIEQDQSVYFEVEGLTEEDIRGIYDRNLHLNAEIAWECTSKGIIIPGRPGDIFIGGLWVCNLPEFKYGYNFKPEYISLDRDRRLVRAFDVSWLTCQMWSETSRYEIVNGLIKEDAPDTKYLDSFIYSTNEGLADQAAKTFLCEHGNNAIAVSSQSELKEAQEVQHQKIVLVKPIEKQLLHRSSLYIEPKPPVVIKTPREELLDFKTEHTDSLSSLQNLQLDALIEKASSWVKI